MKIMLFLERKECILKTAKWKRVKWETEEEIGCFFEAKVLCKKM